MTETVLRAASASDAGALAALEAAIFSDAWSETSLGKTLASPLTAAFLLKEAGETVGYLIASYLAPEGELLRIGVHPAYRKRGYGARLMERFLAEAKRRGCDTLFLEVRRDNAGAISLYRRYGFLDNGVRRGYYKNPTADALLMRYTASEE